MGNHRELAELIRRQRQTKGYTLRGLGKQVEIDAGYLSKIENNKFDRPPTRKAIAKLAEVLEIDEYTLNLIAGHIPLVIKPLVVKFLRVTGDRAREIMMDAIETM